MDEPVNPKRESKKQKKDAKGLQESHPDFTDEEIQHIGRLAGLGLSEKHIGWFFEMSETTFEEKKKKDQRIRRAIRKGRSIAYGKIAQALGQAALNGNVTAMIFYLKTQARWTQAAEFKDDKNQQLEGDIIFKTEIDAQGRFIQQKIVKPIEVNESSDPTYDPNDPDKDGDESENVIDISSE